MDDKRKLIILEVYFFDGTARYGFNNIQDLCIYLSSRVIFRHESCYIYETFFNEDRIKDLEIKIIEKSDY